MNDIRAASTAFRDGAKPVHTVAFHQDIRIVFPGFGNRFYMDGSSSENLALIVSALGLECEGFDQNTDAHPLITAIC